MLIVKKASLSAMINKVQLTWFIFQNQWLLKGLGMKFTDSYDNRPQMKQDEHTLLSNYLSNIYDNQLKDNLNIEGANKMVSNMTEKKTQFFCSWKLWI